MADSALHRPPRASGLDFGPLKLRDQYILSTKVGRLIVDDPGVWDFSADGVRCSLGWADLRDRGLIP